MVVSSLPSANIDFTKINIENPEITIVINSIALEINPPSIPTNAGSTLIEKNNWEGLAKLEITL
jgi:hypothetical protein